MDLLDALDDACRSPHGLSGPDGTTSWAQLWELAARSAGGMDDQAGAGAPIGVMLTATTPAVAAVAGALRSGRDLVSLPAPSRGVSAADYARDLVGLCDLAGVGTLIADDEVVSLLEGAGVADRLHLTTFESLLSGRVGADRDGGRLVQFTSGSTSRPKGIPLTTTQLGFEAAAIAERCELGRDRAGVSWLPLSHDMGLVGMLLCQWAMGAPLALSDPGSFLTRPASWLEALSAQRGYVTAVPNFALDLTVRALERGGRPTGLDLSALGMLICGSDVVRPASLRRFTQALDGTGFRSRAIAPAYGMAEAVLAVSILGPDQHWGSVRVSGEDLVDGRLTVVEADSAGSVELTGCGTPLAGFTVQGGTLGAEGGQVAELELCGPALFDGYLGREARQGAHRTGDLGAVVSGGELDGQLLITGRVDDMLSLRGRNLYAIEMEAALSAISGLRAGCAYCVADEDGGYLVVAEASDGADRRQAARAARAALAKGFGIAPSAVWFAPPGSLPKTTSGKKQRARLAAAVVAGTVEVEERVIFGRR